MALKNLDLRVPKGISGFIGPNGAGKTTTINILIGLLKPDSGEACVFNLDCWHKSYEIRRRVGVLHEKPGYPGNLTGIRYLGHIARIWGVPRPTTRSRKVLSEVGLHKAGDKVIKGYSAGMLQRLGLAQALIGDPELVILDEPTANLDPSGRSALLERIKELCRDRGVNFFVSTHILLELERICNWVSIIKDGTIVDQGFVKDLAIKYSANIYKIEISNPDLFVAAIQNVGSVEKAWVKDGVAYCKVRITEEFWGEVPRIVSELGLRLKSFHRLFVSLDEIYGRTIGEESDEKSF